MDKIDVSTFTRDTSFYTRLPLLLTVKSFDLQAIRTRYIASKNNNNEKIGSFKRREIATGGIVSVSIEAGKLSHSEVLTQLSEPRGISSKDGVVAISSESKVYILDGNEVKEITDDWFSYIHTVDFHPTQEIILVSSSGLDTLLEFDFKTGKKIHDWCAWDNGLDQSKIENGESITLTRSISEAKSLAAEGAKHKLITNPKLQTLPTAQRAAFINSSFYDPDNPRFVYATLFHEGTVRKIDLATGDSEIVIGNLQSPHGGMNYREGTMVTNTRGGSVEYKSDFEQLILDFSNLEGKPKELGDAEWLQNSLNTDNIIVTIDSNRTSFVIIDPVKKCYDMIPYDNNWAVQDLVIFNEDSRIINQLRSI